jgi:hypothetical protein
MRTISTLLPNARIPAGSQGGDAPRRSSSFLRLLETHQPRFQGADFNVLVQPGQSAVDIGFITTQQNQLETEGHRKAAVAENNADARIWWAVLGWNRR